MLKFPNPKKINYSIIKFACFSSYFTMATVFILPSLLFVTFHETYNISYTLLGTLVLTNFLTQLAVDLLFIAFSKYIKLEKVTRIIPLVAAFGLLVYAVLPPLFPNHAFLGLFAGTFIFSVAAGLLECLLSPTIASIPSENPQKDMSTLHSLYGFGAFFVVVVSTVFFKLFGTKNWMFLVVLFSILLLIPSILFSLSAPLEMKKDENSDTKTVVNKKNFGLFLCVGCIFFGSCAENAMTNWISGFAENALHINKALGDIFGIALFAILLGSVRVAYSKYAKNIHYFMLYGMIASIFCYLAAAFAKGALVPFVACVLTGLVTSLLWPGALMMMEENVPGVGVAAYAMMASSGDFGASFAPQLMGYVIDKVSESDFAANLAVTTGYTTEQIGMKAGMCVTAIFPIIGVVFIIMAFKFFKLKKQ